MTRQNHLLLVFCSDCEKRCRYLDSVRKYIESKIAVNKVLEKWEQRAYAPAALVSFLNSGRMILSADAVSGIFYIRKVILMTVSVRAYWPLI